MGIADHNRYFLDFDDTETVLKHIGSVTEDFVEATKATSGKVFLSADDGLRPWWQRFIFGAKVYVRMYFTVKWSGETCALIFYDENGSEYRARSKSDVAEVDAEVRRNLSFGESELLENKYCISRSEAFNAINEFLEKGNNPKCLDYDFVE